MEWISVKDRLPENDEDVLLARYGGLLSTGVFYNYDVGGYSESGIWWSNSEVDKYGNAHQKVTDVIYWKYITPPKEDVS